MRWWMMLSNTLTLIVSLSWSFLTFVGLHMTVLICIIIKKLDLSTFSPPTPPTPRAKPGSSSKKGSRREEGLTGRWLWDAPLLTSMWKHQTPRRNHQETAKKPPKTHQKNLPKTSQKRQSTGSPSSNTRKRQSFWGITYHRAMSFHSWT